LATFNELKKQEADLDTEFAEDVRKELLPADPLFAPTNAEPQIPR
jgi:hypothetical protein